jgi:stearoyl-CoA desaturase (delta-9 desaturase)
MTVFRLRSAPFVIAHLIPLAALLTGVSAGAVVLCAVLFYARMFFITAGYHRYFAHKSYRVGRVPRFLMALGGTSAAQKGPLWWAAHHRLHHRYADTDRDPHSPQRGFWWSHVGWILSDESKQVDYGIVRDLTRYPEIRFIDRHNWIGPWALGAASFLIAGWQGLVVGFFLSTVLLWHATFAVNSLAHVFGRRRYATTDTSRNSFLLALLTSGEGWHNNHHFFPSSARQGFYWWEVDFSWYGLRLLSLLGLVRDYRTPQPALRTAGRIRDGHVDVGLVRTSLDRARAAVTSARSNTGELLAGARTAAADARSAAADGTRQALDAKKEALQHLLDSAVESAEELGRGARRTVAPRPLEDNG